MRRAMGSPATQCSVSWPLPMSCSRADTIRTSGRATRRIRVEASMQVSTRCRSTVKRCTTDACGSSRTRSHSGRIRSRAPVSSRVSHTPSRPGPAASSRTKRSRASTGHGSGSGRRVTRQPGRRRSAPAPGRARPPRRPRGGAAAGPRPAFAPRSSTTSSKESGDPGRDRLEPRSAAAGGTGPPLDRLRASPGQAGQVREPARETTGVDLGGVGVGQAEDRGDLVPVLRHHPVRGAPGHGVQGVADVEQRDPAALEVAVGYVDQPAGHQRLEHRARRAARPTDSLRSGTEACASSPVIRPRSETSSRSSPRRVRASRRHWFRTAERSRSVRLGSPARWRASSIPLATRRSAADCSSTSSTVRTEWSMFAPESHSGYQIWPAQSPISTSGSWTSTTSRSLNGASSCRP